MPDVYSRSSRPWPLQLAVQEQHVIAAVISITVQVCAKSEHVFEAQCHSQHTTQCAQFSSMCASDKQLYYTTTTTAVTTTVLKAHWCSGSKCVSARFKMLQCAAGAQCCAHHAVMCWQLTYWCSSRISTVICALKLLTNIMNTNALRSCVSSTIRARSAVYTEQLSLLAPSHAAAVTGAAAVPTLHA
eukprot:9958-Heterococcus_DN1.PRE.2